MRVCKSVFGGDEYRYFGCFTVDGWGRGLFVSEES